MAVSTLRKLLLLFCLLCITWAGSAHAAPVNDPLGRFFVTDGQVNAIVQAGGLIYIGGAFTKVRPYTGHGVALNVTTGVEDSLFPRVSALADSDADPNTEGSVFVVLSAGANGWYIGGQFDHVGTVARNGLAHINANKTVDTTWDPHPSDGAVVRAMFISGSTLYIAGSFSSVGGQERVNIASVNLQNNPTGQPTSWAAPPAPHADTSLYGCKGPVRAILAPGNGNVYVGGAFQQDIVNPTVPTCGGQVRNHIAALNASTGLAITSWNPNANLDVRVLALSPNSNKLYVAGNFTTISGQSRNKIAEIDLSVGTATSWNPNIDLQVLALKVSGSIVYVGGGFTCIGPATNTNLCGQTGGTPRNRIAALQVSDGAATAWNPDANSSVEAIEVSGGSVYVGGTFTPTLVVPNSIGGQPRNNIAALSASTGQATSWDPNVNAAVHTLALAGSTVYAGGEFDSAGGETPRNNIAAFNETTGAITAADPNANGPVHALATFGNTVYVGGDFTTLSGGALLRNGIAALDVTSGAPSLWNPTATGGGVKALAVSPDGNTVYAGGDFTAIGGALRSHIAALTTAGSATAWDPGADGAVYALATTNNKVYVGGSFTTIGGASRSNLAFLKGTGTTNLLQPWDPSPNLPVYAILVGSTTACTSGTGLTPTVYIGGEFTSLSGGAQRVHIAAIKSSGSGTICTWRPDAIGGPVRALALSGDSLFIGGDFTSAGGVSPLNRLAAVDVVSGSASSWNPNANSPVRALAVSNVTGTLYTGGSFSTLAGSTNPAVGLPRNNFAAFSFGTLLALVTPLSSAVQVGGLAAAFVGVYNGTSTLATNVTIAPKTPITGSPPFHFFPYNPATGFGTPDTPVNIPPGGQVFLVSFAPSVEINPPTFPPTEVKFAIEGTNTTAAASITGLNTLFLAASTTPIANIFTVTLAPLYTLPGPSGAAVFVVPSVNLGAGQAITVLPKGTGDVDSNNVILQICRANPTTGACLASPGSSVNVNPFASGAAAYFNIFVQGLGNSISCDLIANRIFIEFREGSSTGPLRGVASVVLCTL